MPSSVSAANKNKVVRERLICVEETFPRACGANDLMSRECKIHTPAKSGKVRLVESKQLRPPHLFFVRLGQVSRATQNDHGVSLCHVMVFEVIAEYTAA